jgi:hypothetical protein
MVSKNEITKTYKPSTLRFYGDEFVFNTVSGKCYRVTSTAGFLLRALVAGAENEQLVDLIQARYGVDRTAAVRDVELLLNDLAEQGVLD